MRRPCTLLAVGALVLAGCERQPTTRDASPPPQPAAAERELPKGVGPRAAGTEALVRRIIAELLNLKPERISLTSTWQQLGADSLDTVELVMAFEEQFGVEISDERAESMKTVGDVVSFLSQQKKK